MPFFEIKISSTENYLLVRKFKKSHRIRKEVHKSKNFSPDFCKVIIHYSLTFVENTITTNTTTTDPVATVQEQVQVAMKMPPWHEWYDNTALPLIMLQSNLTKSNLINPFAICLLCIPLFPLVTTAAMRQQLLLI